MPTLEDLIKDIQDPRFSHLPSENQANVISQHLSEIYGEKFTSLDPDRQKHMINYTVSEYAPRSLTEKIVEHLPVVGPLAEQYAYNRNVKASPLVEKIVGKEISQKYGAALTVAEDLALIGASIYTLGLTAPALLRGTALEGASIISNSFLRESAIGGLYEVGKLVTTPPSSVGEAVERIGTSAVLGGVIGVGFEGAGAALHGRFGELFNPTSDKVNARNIVKEYNKLYPDDPAAVKAGVEGFYARGQSGVNNLTDEDLSIMLRVAGDRTSTAAQDMKQQVERLQRERAVNSAVQQDVTLNRQYQTEVLNEQMNIARTASESREIELAEIDRLAAERLRGEFRLSARERTVGNIEEAQRLSQERLQRITTRERANRARDFDIEQNRRSARNRVNEFGREEQLRAMEDLGPYENSLENLTDITQEQTRLKELETSNRRTRQQEREGIKTAAQRESDQKYRNYQNAQLAESNRRKEASAALDNIQRGRREAVRPEMTKSEEMLAELHSDPALPRDGFIGNEPVTLPMGMMTDQGPVIVDRFNAGQGILRSGKGMIARTALREARTPEEVAALRDLMQSENIGSNPTRSEAISILESRRVAEQAVRQADIHKMRGDFADNTKAQTQEFNLRRGATEALLSATNRPFSPEIYQSLAQVKPLAGNRIVASLDNIPTVREANDVMQSLGGSGFENVKLVPGREGGASVTFTRGSSELENEVSYLHQRSIQYKDVVDPTSRTYSGLTVEQHEKLGESFGLTDKEIKRYINFVEQTLDDASSRSIRVPAEAETLGIRPIEEQVASKQRSADSIRPDAVIDAERMQRFEVGDYVSFEVGGQKIEAMIESMAPAIERRNIPPRPVLKNIDGNLIGPMTQEQLRTAEAKREITKPLGQDPTTPLSLDSPASTLEALVNPETRQAPLVAIAANPTGIRQGAAELGMRSSINSRTGDITLTLNGAKIKFSGASSLEDATRFINGMRFLSEDKRRMISMFGGPNCLK